MVHGVCVCMCVYMKVISVNPSIASTAAGAPLQSSSCTAPPSPLPTRPTPCLGH